MLCRLFGCRCPCLLCGRLCERIWSGKYTFLATYENCEICRYFPRKLLRSKYTSVGEWRMGCDRESRDRTEREGTGWKGTDHGTAWRGTGRDPHTVLSLSVSSRPSTLSRPSPYRPIPIHAIPSLSTLSSLVLLRPVPSLSMPFCPCPPLPVPLCHVPSLSTPSCPNLHAASSLSITSSPPLSCPVPLHPVLSLPMPSCPFPSSPIPLCPVPSLSVTSHSSLANGSVCTAKLFSLEISTDFISRLKSIFTILDTLAQPAAQQARAPASKQLLR